MSRALRESLGRADRADGQERYVKFVVLGRGRTGTSFLSTSLASHPDAVVHGELFNRALRERRKLDWAERPRGGGSDEALLALLEQDPVAFLDRAVFPAMPVSVRAVGFKLFYYHARSDELERVWHHLRVLGVRAIHLRRRNVLATLASVVTAERTGEWKRRSPWRRARVEPVVLDVDACRRFFETTRALEAEVGGHFERTMDLDYEDLVADHAGRMRAVQDYLELPPRRLRSPMRQQATAPLAHRIANFDALRRAFEGTPWSEFFEPSPSRPITAPASERRVRAPRRSAP